MVVSLGHLPFNMNTRVCMRLFDPSAVVPAGAGWAALVSRESVQNDGAWLNHGLEWQIMSCLGSCDGMKP
jgi:hypothetical protein